MSETIELGGGGKETHPQHAGPSSSSPSSSPSSSSPKDDFTKGEIEMQAVGEGNEEIIALVDGGDSEERPGDDDPHGHHGTGPPGTASKTQAAFNIIISFVGAGMLGMPYAFMKSGWVLGTIVLTCVSSANVYCMLLLTKTRTKLLEQGHKDLHGYGDVGRVIMGSHGEAVVNVCLLISQTGFATAYIIFISANIYTISQIDPAFICFGCVPILSILIQARDMKTLSPFSLVADVAIFTGVCAVLFEDFEEYEPHKDTIKLFDMPNLTYVAAISVYSLEGVGLILPLESSLKEPEAFPFLLKSVITGITLLMAVFGTAGYLAFGDRTLAPITLNLLGSKWASFVKLSLCLALYLTYPIMMFPVSSVLEGTVTSLQKSVYRIPFRFMLVLFTAVIAYSIPNFGEFLSLVGSSICVILGFIFPCYFHLKVFGKELSWSYWVFDIFLIVFGVALGVKGTFDSLHDLLLGDGESR